MKVAIIHDWLTGMRGGERCLEVLCEIFPGADLFTLLHIPGSVSPRIEKRRIRTSFIQHLPFSKRRYRTYLPLFPLAIEQFSLRGYDLILSCSHCVAKGVIPPPEALHISYVLTPMRYAWDMYGDYFGRSGCRGISFFMHYLRMWDVTSSERVDHFLCISRHVQNRIKRFYRREAEVIHPPLDGERFRLPRERGDFFLMVSSFVPYKRIDLAVEAVNRLGHSLKIIGTGPEEKRIRQRAKPNIEFLGWLPDETVSTYYSKCRALIFPGEEDFGIVPLEAMASGRPVIAYGRGGAIETVIPYDQGKKENGRPPTGLFFYEQKADALVEAVEAFIRVENDFDPKAIRKHSLQWDLHIFRERMRKSIFEKIESTC